MGKVQAVLRKNQLQIRYIRLERALNGCIEPQLGERLFRERHRAKLWRHEWRVGQKKSFVLVTRDKPIMLDQQDAIAALCEESRGQSAPELTSDDNHVVDVPRGAKSDLRSRRYG